MLGAGLLQKQSDDSAVTRVGLLQRGPGPCGKGSGHRHTRGAGLWRHRGARPSAGRAESSGGPSPAHPWVSGFSLQENDDKCLPFKLRGCGPLSWSPSRLIRVLMFSLWISKCT